MCPYVITVRIPCFFSNGLRNAVGCHYKYKRTAYRGNPAKRATGRLADVAHDDGGWLELCTVTLLFDESLLQ
jgi:hypothetical protein